MRTIKSRYEIVNAVAHSRLNSLETTGVSDGARFDVPAAGQRSFSRGGSVLIRRYDGENTEDGKEDDEWT